MILAIDPGNVESAFVIMDKKYRPLEFGKWENDRILGLISCSGVCCKEFVIEMVASYGMAVGATVFETCVWIGRFIEAAERVGMKVTRVYRKDVKMNLCNSMKAKDSNIRQALIDRFAQHDLKNGKGTKGNPDWFYGVSKDVWSAIAVSVTYYDLYLKNHIVKR